MTSGRCPHLLAIEVGVSSKGSSRASEGEHGKGDGDGNVDTNLCTGKHTEFREKHYKANAGIKIQRVHYLQPVGNDMSQINTLYRPMSLTGNRKV